MEATKDSEAFFVNVALGGKGEISTEAEDSEAEEVECLRAEEEYNLWIKRQESKRENW